MKFFDRGREIALLREIRGRSRDVAQFSVVTGRRRVGRTSLISKAYEDEKFVYLFVERQESGSAPSRISSPCPWRRCRT